MTEENIKNNNKQRQNFQKNKIKLLPNQEEEKSSVDRETNQTQIRVRVVTVYSIIEPGMLTKPIPVNTQ